MNFELSIPQVKKLEEWISLRKETVKDTGAIGGRFTFCFTPTSLGTVITVKDSVDNSTIDISDYTDW